MEKVKITRFFFKKSKALWLEVATAAAKSVLPSALPRLGRKAWKAASALNVSEKTFGNRRGQTVGRSWIENEKRKCP